MDNDITYKTILNSIIPNKIFDDMACEACATKFTLFKRKVNNFSACIFFFLNLFLFTYFLVYERIK